MAANPELDAEIGAFGLTSVGGEGLPWSSEQGVPGETGGGNTDVRPTIVGTEDVPADSRWQVWQSLTSE